MYLEPRTKIPLSERDLMKLIPRLSGRLLKLFPLTHLIRICKSSFPSFSMRNKLLITMLLGVPKSTLASTGCRLEKILITNSTFLKAHHTNIGIKNIKQGNTILSNLSDIVQVFVHPYENSFSS